MTNYALYLRLHNTSIGRSIFRNEFLLTIYYCCKMLLIYHNLSLTTFAIKLINKIVSIFDIQIISIQHEFQRKIENIFVRSS
jgi:hypothetical protein